MNLNDTEKEIYGKLNIEEQSDLQAMWADTALRNKVTKLAAIAIGVLVLATFLFS